jgi:hypothetical protein
MSAQVQQVVASSKSLSGMAEELKRAVMVFKLGNETVATSFDALKAHDTAGKTQSKVKTAV